MLAQHIDVVHLYETKDLWKRSINICWSWLLSERLQQFSQEKRFTPGPECGSKTQWWRNFMQIAAASKSQAAPTPKSNVSEPTSSGDLLEDGQGCWKRTMKNMMETVGMWCHKAWDQDQQSQRCLNSLCIATKEKAIKWWWPWFDHDNGHDNDDNSWNHHPSEKCQSPSSRPFSTCCDNDLTRSTTSPEPQPPLKADPPIHHPGSDGDDSATEQTHQELRDAQGHVEIAIQLPQQLLDTDHDRWTWGRSKNGRNGNAKSKNQIDPANHYVRQMEVS